MGILQWASHFKNVRCLLVFEPEIRPEKEVLSWIVKKHRYRQVGIPPALASLEERLSRSPFVTLFSPHPTIDELIKVLERTHLLWFAQCLMLSFCYAAPLLCLDRGLISLLVRFSPWSLWPREKVPEAEVIRHLRIAGYVPIDFFPWVEKAYQILREGDEGRMKEMARIRKEDAMADGKKRFWRLADEDGGLIFASYLDLFPYLAGERKWIQGLLDSEYLGLVLTVNSAIFL